MLRALPGVFVAGEMLDWEAPTGGYLLQATFATAWRRRRGADRAAKPASSLAEPRPLDAPASAAGHGSTVTRRMWRRWPG